jgi:hypothetical protein
MMKIPDENIRARTTLRWMGTWSLARMGIGITRMQTSDLKVDMLGIHPDNEDGWDAN